MILLNKVIECLSKRSEIFQGKIIYPNLSKKCLMLLDFIKSFSTFKLLLFGFFELSIDGKYRNRDERKKKMIRYDKGTF